MPNERSLSFNCHQHALYPPGKSNSWNIRSVVALRFYSFYTSQTGGKLAICPETSTTNIKCWVVVHESLFSHESWHLGNWGSQGKQAVSERYVTWTRLARLCFNNRFRVHLPCLFQLPADITSSSSLFLESKQQSETHLFHSSYHNVNVWIVYSFVHSGLESACG